MNRKAVIAILFCFLLVGLLFWFLDSPEPQQAQNTGKPKQFSAAWQIEYAIESKDPRGIGFFNELLKTHTQDSVYILKNWSDLEDIPGHDSATYLFVGENFGLFSYEFEQLETYVDSGATMLLSFDQATDNIYQRFFYPNGYMWEYTNRFHVYLGDTSLAFSALFQNDTIYTDWYPFRPSAIKDTLYKAFAWGMNHPIAFESKLGKGKIIMQSVPRLFCNYQVITPNGFAHTSIILRRIPKHKPVIWLEYGRRFQQQPTSVDNSDEEGEGNEKQDNSYLQFIMKNEALRWAFLLGILVFLLYVLFRAKRREAVLPGVPEKRNMSLAFVETLSSIYLSRNSPYGVMLVLRKNFYTAIQRHFYIDLLNSKNREQDVERLIEKSGVDGDELRKTIAFLESRKPETVNQVTLANKYRYIRRFYVETGISKVSEKFVQGDKNVVLSRNIWIGTGGLIFAFFTLMRGLYSLSMGSGYGILLVIAALLLLYLAARSISLPVAIIKENELIYYGNLFSKTTLDLTAGVSQTTSNGSTTILSEKGGSVTINHALLSRTGKHELSQFVEHIKHKTA